ncbi:MAG TPA: GTP cyclohydrolase I [Anaeromyxobacteraceae bacterium]|nr:GTP cyclohydrolase I [Anaeromyxobacteraceae bacterium]
MPAERAARARAESSEAGAGDPSSRLVAAIEQFLDALGLPAEVRRGEHLADTPRRVAEAWRDDLVDGYRADPAALLSDSMPAAGRGLVVLTGIDYHSMCPHHLLPSRGNAHVAYVPGDRVVGFGQLARLVDCFAHRLVLEEDLARNVADALVEHLGARGAACALDAEQTCLTVRGERRRHARAHAQAFAGSMARDRALQRRFLSAIAATAASGKRASRGEGRGISRTVAASEKRASRGEGNAGARPVATSAAASRGGARARSTPRRRRRP